MARLRATDETATVRTGRLGSGRCRLSPAAWTFSVLAPLAAAAAGADSAPLLVEEGTDLSISASGESGLYLQLAGRLWRLPADGGDAVPVSPAGERAARPALSPDGRSLAYESVRDGFIQIVVAGADGAGARQVTSGPWNHLAPAWSRDGGRLALASDRSGELKIWELDLDSLALRQVSFEPGAQLDPAWSPVDDELAYVSVHGGRSALVLRPPFRPSRVLTMTAGPMRAPAWRPDGSVLTYVDGRPPGARLNMVILSEPPVTKAVAPNEIAAQVPASWLDRGQFLYAADGRIRHRQFGGLQAREIPFRVALAVNARAAPAPRRLPDLGDSQPVRAVAGIAPLPGGHIIASALGDLWELDAAGKLVRAVTASPHVERDPAASKDGRHLAFSSDRDGNTQIWVADLATGELDRITTEPGEARHPAWAGQGDRIAYFAGPADGEAGASLKFVSLDTGAVTVLATGLGSTSAPSWSADGATIGVLQAASGAPQLLLLSTDRPGERRRLTLPAATIDASSGQLQFAADGRTLLLASRAGIYLLPVMENGLVGADGRTLSDQPVHSARWLPGTDNICFTDEGGLGRIAPDQPPTRIELDLRWQAAATPGRSTIRASRVFDGLSGGYLLDQDVVIEDGRIVAVTPATAEPVGRLIDARDKTVLPGLIDLAVDLSGAGNGRAGRTLLAYGVTTVQAINAAGPALRELAERWRAQRSGPRVARLREWCNPAPATTETDAVVIAGGVELCPLADEATASLASMVRKEGLAVWSADWRAAATGTVDAVRAAGPGPQPDTAQLLSAGAGIYYQDAIEVIIRSGTTFLPGLGTSALPLMVAEQPDLLGSAQFLYLLNGEQQAIQRRDSGLSGGETGRRRSWLQARQRLVGQITAGGGVVAAGSGAEGAALGLALHAELRALAHSGLHPGAVLRAATVASAHALGLQEELGSIAAGRVADLLIVDGDPLADLSSLLRIEAVMLEGELQPMGRLLDRPGTALEKFTLPASDRTAKPGRKGS